MAIYMLNLSHVSAAADQSAAAKCNYILREGKYADDTGELVQSGHAFMPDFAEADPRSF